jgi:predicted chitinase
MTTTNRLVDNFSGLKHISLPVIGFPKPNSTNKIETKNIVDKKLFNRLALSLNENSFQTQPSESKNYVNSKADELINNSKISVKKIEPAKMMDFLAKSSVTNPKLVASTLYRPELAENRYYYAKGILNRLDDKQLAQISKTEDGRKFLRTTVEIVAEGIPKEANNQPVINQNIKLIEKVRDKMFEASGKNLKDYYGNNFRTEFQNGVEAKLAKQSDSLINQGKITEKVLDFEKFTNNLSKESTKAPWKTGIALFRAEGEENAYKYALGLASNLSDEKLAELSHTQPGRNLLLTTFGLIQNAPQYSKGDAMTQVAIQQLNRINKAFETDNIQRQNFKGITSDQLVQAMKFHGLSKERADELLPELNKAMYEYEIDTPMKQAMFLAQLGHESKGLTDFTEDAGDKNPNLYGGFFGRGAIQITGRSWNYEPATLHFGIPLLDNPNLATDPKNTFQLAGWFLKHQKNVEFSKIVSGSTETAFDEFIKVGKMVNSGAGGKIIGYNQRLEYYKNTLNALQIDGRETIIAKIDEALKLK